MDERERVIEKKIKASDDAEPDVVAHKKIKRGDGEPDSEQVIEKKIKASDDAEPDVVAHKKIKRDDDDEPDVEAHVFARRIHK
jgi:hypothetical protein